MNEQEVFWSGPEGTSYIKRNFNINNRYQERFSFFNLFKTFNDKNINILEVGCNCGINLQILKDLNFKNLNGIDINKNAILEAKKRMPEYNFYEGSIFNLPFEDNSFDLVFTSGVLIHQDPDSSLQESMKEINRCAKTYIIGLEDYSSCFAGRSYRGKNNFYWSGPFKEKYISLFPELNLLESGFIKDRDSTLQREYYKFKK